MTNTHDQGDLVRCTGTFYDEDDAVADPSDVTFYLKGPNTDVTYEYGTDAELVRLSEGVYYVDFSVPVTGREAAGTYTYRFEGTGSNQAADEGTFVVSNSGIHG